MALGPPRSRGLRLDLLAGFLGGALGDLAERAAVFLTGLLDGLSGAGHGDAGDLLGVRHGLLSTGLDLFAGASRRGSDLLPLEIGVR
ncbi:MAG: hypothetical protein QOD83_2902 [Solirubrobacteraceae bacterium]|nr:hypothetical protein [Solirubrobacteraceae bacterium]